MSEWKKNQKNIVVTLFTLWIILSSCSHDNSVLEATNITQPTVLTSTITQVPEPSLTMTPTVILQETEPFVSNCVSMQDTLPQIDDLQGKLIVEKKQSDVYIYDIETESSVFLDGIYYTYVISPDHSMIAFLDNSARWLIISDITGNVIERFVTDPVNMGQNLYPAQWLDNQHILMFARGMGEYPNYLAPYAAIFDLESGRSEKIAMDFPGLTFDRNEQGANWYYGWTPGDYRLAVSPDRDYLAYPAIEGSDGIFVIWDRDSNEEVSRLNGTKPRHTVPRWSPDGDQFAVMSVGPDVVYWWDSEEYTGDEIFLFDRFGSYEKITKFESDSPGNISFLSWSPDGNRIAFWMDLYDAPDRHHLGGNLFVINLETDSVVNHCIEGRGELNWSLDGNYLFINTFIQGETEEYSVAVVNLVDLWSVKLDDLADVYGVINEE
ncbi:MAG: hypothetical protein ABFS32_20690 [Bacteroidota bacterium]